MRLACQELESFYLGDLAAVGKALSLPKPAQAKRKFCSPDLLKKPSEILRLLTNGIYSKINGSRLIGEIIALDGSNRSTSFGFLLKTLLQLKEEASIGPLFDYSATRSPDQFR